MNGRPTPSVGSSGVLRWVECYNDDPAAAFTKTLRDKAGTSYTQHYKLVVWNEHAGTYLDVAFHPAP